MLESSDLARAVADYHKALADNQVKQKELARSQDLLDHKAISEREFQQAQGDAQQSPGGSASRARAGAGVWNGSRSRVDAACGESPSRGRGSRCRGGAPANFRRRFRPRLRFAPIADITTVWAVGDIYEKDLAAAKSGEAAQVTLNAYPDQHWTGRVSVVSAAVDPTTRTLHVRVVLPNAGSANQAGDVRLDPAAAVVDAGDSRPVDRRGARGERCLRVCGAGKWPVRAARREAGPGGRRHLEILRE